MERSGCQLNQATSGNALRLAQSIITKLLFKLHLRFGFNGV